MQLARHALPPSCVSCPQWKRHSPFGLVTRTTRISSNLDSLALRSRPHCSCVVGVGRFKADWIASQRSLVPLRWVTLTLASSWISACGARFFRCCSFRIRCYVFSESVRSSLSILDVLYQNSDANVSIEASTALKGLFLSCLLITLILNCFRISPSGSQGPI
jgi:hypothetical protein